MQTNWLLLGDLYDEMRGELEKQARAHALEVHHRLFPVFVSKSEFKAALMEAVLLQNPGQEAMQGNTLSTYLIPRHPSAGGDRSI